MSKNNIDVDKLREIGKEEGLSQKNLSRFVNFMIVWSEKRNRNMASDFSYASEWANRFAKGSEYSHASGDATVSLVEIDGFEDAVYRFTKELDDYNGKSPKHKKDAEERIIASFESENIPIPKKMKGVTTSIYGFRKERKQIKDDISQLENSVRRMI